MKDKNNIAFPATAENQIKILTEVQGVLSNATVTGAQAENHGAVLKRVNFVLESIKELNKKTPGSKRKK